jgi:hypothetical protein
MRNAYKTAVEYEGKIPLVRPKCRWKDNIEMYSRETRLECVDWTHLAQETDHRHILVSTAMKFEVPFETRIS